MVGFRVLVDLSQYFSDFRQKSWVYVDSNRFKTLSDLKKHICEVFVISDDFEIFVCDSYIPSKEDVGIINEKDVLELRKSSGDADIIKALGDVSVEGENRKRKKKRKTNNLDSQLDTDQSTGNIDPLPENFNPECNSTMTVRKKRKSSSPVEECMECSISDIPEKLGKKKSKLAKGNGWNAREVAYSSTVQITNEELENSTSVCIGNERKRSSSVNASPSTKNCLETSGNDFQEMNISEVKEVANGETRNVSSSAQSTFDNSLLEHTVFEVTGDFAEREGVLVETPIQKRKRNRRAKRKRRNISVSNSPVSELKPNISNAAAFSVKQSSGNNISNSKKHKRFSDSEDYEEVSVPPTTENHSIEANGQNTNFSNEASGAISVDARLKECSMSSNLDKASMFENATLCNEKITKEVDSHDQVTGIFKYESTDSVKNATASCEFQSSCLPVGRRPKKAVLNTGLGATLAHLMKNDKKSETCVPNVKPSNSKSENKTHPLPSTPDNPSSSKRNYSEFPIVEKFPRQGDILAFKILKMNDHYEPCISNFVECLVSACDQDHSTVTIRILEGVKEFDKVNGKFEIQLEDEEEENKSKDVVLTMEWKEFLQPRLIFP